MMNSVSDKKLDSFLYEFNPQGRLEYFKIVKDLREKGEALENRRLNIQYQVTLGKLGFSQEKLMKNTEYKDYWEKEYLLEKQNQRKKKKKLCGKIIFNKSFVTQKSKSKLDRKKVFLNRHEMCKYLEPFLDEAGDMLQNWGVLEWVSAFYSSQQLRTNEAKDPLITIAWHICMATDDARIEDENYGGFSNQNLKRHMIHHHFMYHKRFKNHPAWKKWLSQEKEKDFRRLANNYGDYFEQVYANKRERLTINLANFINNNHCTKKGGKSYKELWKYQEYMKIDYHTDKMSHDFFDKQLNEIRDAVTKNK